MDLITRVNQDFKEILHRTNPLPQMETLTERMLEKDMRMRGAPFPTFLKPYFVELGDRKYFERATQLIVSSLNKISKAYFLNNMFQDQIKLTGKLGELAHVNAVYPGYQIVARLDVFFDPQSKQVKFLEFNCGDPSGMGWHDQMLTMFDDLPAIKELGKKYRLVTDRLVVSHEKMFIHKYRQFCEAKGIKPVEKPNMAFVCNRESTILSDYRAFIEYYSAKGYNARLADPRDFDYDGKTLTLKGIPAPLVYRDAISEFIADEYWPDSQAILNAYRDGNVCFINPVSSAAGGFKSVLEILTDERYSSLFSPEEREAHHQFVPWTRMLVEGKTDYRGRSIDLYPYVRSNKELFVLKPNAGYGGYGVLIGKYSEQKAWDELIDKVISDKMFYTVQDFVTIPVDEFPEVKDGEFKGFSPKNVNINFWSHDAEFAGCFVRAASGSIINIHQGGGLVPVYYVAEKN